MATLFFDGFDRGYLLKNLDPNYWSQQNPEFNYPRYSFGAWTYNNALVVSNEAYQLAFYSSAQTIDTIIPPEEANFIPFYGHHTPLYPGAGTAPGFLALNNILINDPNNYAPITYLQLSGFPSIQGSQSYFGIRCLGIETKDILTNDSTVAGRFGNKHPFLAFCSGSYTGLLLSFVRVSGSNILPLRMEGDDINFTGPQETIGLQAEQNGEIKGVFDLNIANDTENYRITPLYWRKVERSDRGGIPTGTFDQINNQSIGTPTFVSSRVLTIACDNETSYVGSILPGALNTPSIHRVISRWVHFEVNLNHIIGSLQIKAEDVDLLVLNNQIENRDSWDVSVSISGFYYDNVKIFNRTYNSGLLSQSRDVFTDAALSAYDLFRNNRYYANGSLTLIDDITLVDNTGNLPTFFLGKTSKVLPLNPGFISGAISSQTQANSRLFSDSNLTYDGPYQWTKSPSNLSNKSILSSYDFDSTKLIESRVNKINVNLYSNNYISGIGVSVPNRQWYEGYRIGYESLWRYQYNDAIGGIKVYNLARKEFLDSNFINIVPKKSYTTNDIQTRYLLHFDDTTLIDSSWYGHDVGKANNAQIDTQGKFNSGLVLNNDTVVITDSEYEIGSNQFTLESWIKFDTNSDELVLFDTKYKPELSEYYLPLSYTRAGVVWHTRLSTAYSLSVNTGCVYIKSWLYNEADICDNPAVLELKLPQPIVTGSWNHIAITRTTINNSGYFNVFLNGVSGTGYKISTLYENMSTSCVPSIINQTGAGSLFIQTSAQYESDYNALSRAFGLLNSKYTNTVLNSLKKFPYVYIHGTGHIDEYRFSQNVVRYTSNFTPPIAPFTGAFDGYTEIGPEISLDRTRYKTFQFYQMYRPDTNEPFDMLDFNNGFRLGVKKL